MAITKAKKEEILSELHNVAVPQKAVVLITTKGADQMLDSENNFKARRAARTKGVQLRIVKNTLIKIAFESIPELDGQTYVAYMENPDNGDEVTVPKVVAELLKNEHKNHFNIVGCVTPQGFLDAAATIRLANTPALEVSIATFAGQLQTITSRIAIGIKEVPSSIARGTKAYSKQLS